MAIASTRPAEGRWRTAGFGGRGGWSTGSIDAGHPSCARAIGAMGTCPLCTTAPRGLSGAGPWVALTELVILLHWLALGLVMAPVPASFLKHGYRDRITVVGMVRRGSGRRNAGGQVLGRINLETRSR